MYALLVIICAQGMRCGSRWSWCLWLQTILKLDVRPEVKERVTSYNKFVRMLPAVRGQVNLSELMNLQANNMSLFDSDVLEEVRLQKPLQIGGSCLFGLCPEDAFGQLHQMFFCRIILMMIRMELKGYEW